MEHAQRIAHDAATEAARGSSSFESFFARHHGDLFAAMWLITRDRQEADEVAQESFLRLWERWERVSGLDDPEGYLFRTAMNVFRSRRRRAGLAIRRLRHETPPDDLIEVVERREVLVHALSSLTPRERAAVVLTDVLGFSSEEAGRSLGIEPVTVRVLASRGRGRLQQEVESDDA